MNFYSQLTKEQIGEALKEVGLYKVATRKSNVYNQIRCGKTGIIAAVGTLGVGSGDLNIFKQKREKLRKSLIRIPQEDNMANKDNIV